MDNYIPFNWPHMTGKELYYIAQAHFRGKLAGDGPFTKQCQQWIEDTTHCSKSLLTHSCTAALELAALAINIQPGDEVIMPSFTFVSTANAFVLRGAVPVFVDIRPDTLNIDETLIEASITPKTKAIVPVHYAGVSCEMDSILALAKQYKLRVVEDAAQGVMSTYKGRALGAIGDLGAYSFHETKNVISGEGGALLINDGELILKSEIIREKGTDRSRFFRGEVDKYTWQEVGSSFLTGELVAAFLWAQLENARQITSARIESWNRYHDAFASLEQQGILRRPIVPADCVHNAHMYYVILSDRYNRQNVIEELHKNDISSVFHYVPLHSSPAGVRYGRADQPLRVTDDLSERLIRLPLWIGLTPAQQDKISESLESILRRV